MGGSTRVWDIALEAPQPRGFSYGRDRSPTVPHPSRPSKSAPGLGLAGSAIGSELPVWLCSTMRCEKHVLRLSLLLFLLSCVNGFVFSLRHSSLQSCSLGSNAFAASKQSRPTLRAAATSLRMENLNSLTVKDLRERLVGLGQSPPSKMKKAEVSYAACLHSLYVIIDTDGSSGGTADRNAVLRLG
eukprot:3006407-Rhodomonas_salina.2